MYEEDVAIYRILARQEAKATNAALCGARPIVGLAQIVAEAMAAEEVTTETPDTLSPRQSRAAAMLATGMNVREVATALDLHRGTIFRWRQSSLAFRNEQRRCAAEAAGRIVGVARRLIVKATGYVERSMEEDGCRSDWAARILRNKNLWELARADAEIDDA
jgi:hypothetical protein